MKIKIILNAFGLTKKMSIPRREERIYLPFMKPLDATFFYGDNINPSVTPGIMKARFQWRGEYKKDRLVYEFMGLDI